MEKLVVIVLILMGFQSRSQDCYHPSSDAINNNYSILWLGKTFQGTIGNANQRIEVRFLDIRKSDNSNRSYRVTGKSKVNKNICDFQGKIQIDTVFIVDQTNPFCEGADYPYGYVTASYVMNEDSTQQHVGTFKGDLKSKFSYSSKTVGSVYRGTEFVGTWKDYNSDQPKYCAWGLIIPPTQKDNLFRHYDNEFHIFNSAFMHRGWKTYVIAADNRYVSVPKDFYSTESRHSEDFESYTQEEIEEARRVENIEWWK